MAKRSAPHSAVWIAAMDRWRAVRLEFEDYREAEFRRAVEELDGALLNDRGRKADIDPYRLFIGQHAFAMAYASEELIEHWARWPRPVFQQFERQYRDEERAS